MIKPYERVGGLAVFILFILGLIQFIYLPWEIAIGMIVTLWTLLIVIQLLVNAEVSKHKDDEHRE